MCHNTETMYKLRQIPSEAQVRKMFRQIIYGAHVYCPQCKSRNVVVYEKRYRCRKCRAKFSLLSGTWLANMKLSYQEFYLILWCWTAQIPVLQAQSLCQMSEKAIRSWYGKFRSHLPKQEDVLEGLIQMDEAYFSDRTLLMLKQCDPNHHKYVYQVLPHDHPCREEIWSLLRQYVKPGSKFNTDASSLYKTIEKVWPVEHTVDVHKNFEFTHTSQIEGTFGNLRTFIRRMYHHATCTNLESLVGEFCFRICHKEIFENPRYFLEISLGAVPTG